MYRHVHFFWILFVTVGLTSCQSNDKNYTDLKRSDFQIKHNGKKVDLYTLKNANDMQVQITNYGGKVVSIIVPDKDGNLGDVCLGYETAQKYIDGIASLGATMGRYANRIAFARFTLNDSTYHLDKNNGPHSIHGGFKGFRFQVWNATQPNDHSLTLTYTSKDGEGGYPGNVKVTAKYSVTADNSLKINYTASTDKPTIINLTNHTFFNLAGEGNGHVLDQKLYVNANHFTPVDSTAIPTGEIRDVKGTPFDFTHPTRIGKRIKQNNKQLKNVGGYDHNFVLNKDHAGKLTVAARLSDPNSGRVMKVLTTEPGLQVYTANSLSGAPNQTGKAGHVYDAYSAVCLETQHFPDSPHHPNFPSTELKPNKDYHSTTIYKFSTK